MLTRVVSENKQRQQKSKNSVAVLVEGEKFNLGEKN